MKKALLVAASLASVCAGTALAADLPSRKAPSMLSPNPISYWNGLYAGVNIGYGWGAGGGNSNVWNLNGLNGGVTNSLSTSGNAGGVIGGGQFGYQQQIGKLVLIGAEADFQGTGMGGGGGSSSWIPVGNGSGGLTFVPNWSGGGQGVNIPFFGTVRGRLGLTPTSTLLVYGTGGFTYADVERNHGNLWGGGNASAWQTGWNAGGGAEWLFTRYWSAKAEYLYTDVSGGNTNWGNNWGLALNNVNNHTRWNTIRLGLNFHFSWLGAPIANNYTPVPGLF